jgi:antitoxin component of RelBE/YafQ-DinJ toxin-antitoxin module
MPNIDIEKLLEKAKKKAVKVSRSFRVDQDVYEAYLKECKRLGYSASALIEEFMKEVISRKGKK